MKFNFFYEDLLQEIKGRPMGPEKFEAISKNLGRWMYGYFGDHPQQLSRIPYFSEFRDYARKVALPLENVDDIEQLVLMLQPEEKSNLMYDYLNQIPDVLKAQQIIKKIGETFETIGKRIKYYDKPDNYVAVRGRKPKEKPDTTDDVVDISKVVKEPENITKEPGEPARRGRKPTTDTLQRLETKYFKMYDDLATQLRVMKELSAKINDYKKYFGK